MPEPEPTPSDEELPPGVHVRRVVRDDGRQLLLYSWPEPGPSPDGDA